MSPSGECPGVQRHTDSNDRHHARFSGSPAASCSTPSSRRPRKPPGDTGGFARCRHFVLRTSKGFQVNFELFVPEAPAVNEIRRARHSPANGLRDEERRRGAIPFFGGRKQEAAQERELKLR